jgi:hypothetical protein
MPVEGRFVTADPIIVGKISASWESPLIGLTPGILWSGSGQRCHDGIMWDLYIPNFVNDTARECFVGALGFGSGKHADNGILP